MNPPAAIPVVTAAVRLLFFRLRHGRPGVLAGRLLAALVLAGIAGHSGAGPAPTMAALAGIATWLALTARNDLAPPPGR